MSAQNVIELGFNVEEISAEQQQVLKIVQDLFEQLKKFDGTRFNPLNGGLTDLKTSLKDGARAMGEFESTAKKYNETTAENAKRSRDNKKATDESTEAEKVHAKTLSDTIKIKAKISEADTNAANDKAIEAERLKLVTAEVNANARAYLSQIGSNNEARAAIKQLTIERDKQNATSEEGRQKIQELNAEIDRNNEFIRLNSAALEKQKINIGNYIGATNTVQQSITELSDKLERMAAAGQVTSEAFQKLTLEQKILEGLQEKQTAGFATITSELRATKSALDALAVAGLDQTEAFEQLNKVYTSSKQKLVELHNEQQILTSEEPAFTALTAAARGLGGAYAVSAGASAIFAEGNEKVEKELNKLVAIMTLLQGLEEAVKAIKDRGAIATALQATATKLLVSAKELELKIFGSSASVFKADTAAKELNTEVTEVNAEATLVSKDAQIASAEGSAVNAAAVEGVTIATEGATAATIGFRTALISTGIGAIIIGIIYGVTKLIEAISDWSQADRKMSEEEKNLYEAAKQNYDLLLQYNEALATTREVRLIVANTDASAASAAGKNQLVQLANQQKIAQLEKQGALERISFLDADGKAYQQLDENKREALEKLQIETFKQNSILSESEKKDQQAKIDAAKSEYDIKNKLFEDAFNAQKDYNTALSKIEDTRQQQQKFVFDELQAFSKDAAQNRYNIEKEANDKILNDDRSMLSGRLTAISENYGAEAKLAENNEKLIRQRVGAGVITEEEGANQIKNIIADLSLKRKAAAIQDEQTRIQYRDRNLAASNDALKSVNDTELIRQNEITANVKRQLDDRLAALNESVALQKNSLDANFKYQIDQARLHGKTQDEIRAIQEAHEKETVGLTTSVQKQITDVVKSYGDDRIKIIQDQNKATSTSNQVSNNYNEQIASLNSALLSGDVSYREYVSKKRKYDEAYLKDKDAAEVADDQVRLDRLKKELEEELKLKINAAEAELTTAKEGGNDLEIKNAKAKVDALKEIQVKANAEDVALTDKLNKDKQKQNTDLAAKTVAAGKFLQEKEKELAQETLAVATQMVEGAYEARINKIQQTIDLQNQQTADEVAAIQRSTLTQQQQAAATTVLINQQRAREKQEKAEQKQEKQKEARFERDIAIANVVWKTAQAEIEALAQYAGTPYAFAIEAVIAATGAASIAAILARPIPAYGQGVGIPGRGEHPGGMALVGELYQPELVKIKDGPSFITDVPTYVNMGPGSSVTPLTDAQVIRQLADAAIRESLGGITIERSRNDDVIRAIEGQTDILKRALNKSNRKINNIINLSDGHITPGYIQDRITGTR